MGFIKEKFDVVLLKKVSIAVTAFMLLAHMYVFTNGALLFDAVGVYRGDANFVVNSDKWAGGLYWWMDLGVNCPWLAGVWATVLMSATVYCICDILNVHTIWGVTLISGICATNTTVIAEQQYTGQNFFIIIPLLEAVLAAWLLRKSKMCFVCRILLAIALIALSAGTYGAMVSMMPAMLLVAVLLDILGGVKAKENWKHSIQYILVFICGMALYYVILRSFLHMQSGSLQSYMGEDAISSISVIGEMVKTIQEAYINLFTYYAGQSRFLPLLLNKVLVVLIILGCIEALLLIWTVRKQLSDKISNGILLVIALVISPAVLNLIYIMSLGHVHYLMIFTYSVPLLAFVRINELLFEQLDRRVLKSLVYLNNVVFVFFVYFSVVMSNAAYTNYHQMYIETISAGTRILERIENCEGFEGTEEVVLLGAMQYNSYWGNPGEQPSMILDAALGSGNPNNINGINYASWTRRFLNNVLGSTLIFVDYSSVDTLIEKEDLSEDEIEAIRIMTAFPADGSVEKIGDRVYVKLSND